MAATKRVKYDSKFEKKWVDVLKQCSYHTDTILTSGTRTTSLTSPTQMSQVYLLPKQKVGSVMGQRQGSMSMSSETYQPSQN